jgi:predicted kinase
MYLLGIVSTIVENVSIQNVTRSPVELTLLIGLPASGKSTLAHRWVIDSPCCVLVSTDAIRANLFGDETIQGPWPLVWREVERQFRHAIAQTHQGLACGAIYDATNAVRRQRREVMQLAIALGFTKITGIWLDCSLETCLAQNQMRQRQVPDTVIEKMYRCLQGAPPSLEDGFSCLVRYHHFPVGKLHPNPP